MIKGLLIAVLLIFEATAVFARVAPEPRECMIYVGPQQVMFSAFQQQRTHEVFCSHIPDSGPTVIILDAQEDELRSMTLEILILRDVGQEDWSDDLDANMQFRLPPKKYLLNKGTASFDYNFPIDGKYMAIVKATNEDGSKDYVGQYFFSVGDTLAHYLSLAVIFGAFCFIAFGIWGRGPAKKDA